MSMGAEMRRTNSERTGTTRTLLLRAAHDLFATQGYSGTSTEAILAETGLTRGALYHHFRDKADLFAALCATLHAEVTAAIGAAAAETTAQGGTSLDVLKRGCGVWIEFMSSVRIHRILLIDAPSVLGWAQWQELDRTYGYATLVDGVRAAQQDGFLTSSIAAERLAQFLNGAINQAVLASAPDTSDASTIIADVYALIDTLAP